MVDTGTDRSAPFQTKTTVMSNVHIIIIIITTTTRKKKGKAGQSVR